MDVWAEVGVGLGGWWLLGCIVAVLFCCEIKRRERAWARYRAALAELFEISGDGATEDRVDEALAARFAGLECEVLLLGDVVAR